MGRHVARPGLAGDLVETARREGLVVLTGPRGAGKSTLLAEARALWPGPAALVRLEPVACTPEILRDEVAALAGPVLGRLPPSAAPMDALQAAVRKRPAGTLLLLDDVTELKTLSYFPGVERPLHGFVEALAASKAPAIATTRLSYWMRRELPALTFRAVPPLSAEELRDAGADEPELLAAATGGLPVHAAHLLDGDLETTLTAGLAPGEAIERECRATLCELLHRARGYGACKAVLRILAEEEGLKLTEVARRLDRTPGSTRDYLRWLEEVDLVVSRERRYYFVDPVLRLWHRIHAQGEPPPEERLRDEVDAYVRRLREALEAAEAEDSAERDATEGDAPFELPEPVAEDLVEID